MADRTLGQVAYEKHAQVFGNPGLRLKWDRRRRNVVIPACTDPGCGDGCNG